MPTRRSILALAGSAVVVVLAASPAAAGAFGIRSFSATVSGQSFAGAAAGSGGLSSTFWNPAVITMSPGYTSEYTLSYIDPGATIRARAPTPTLGLGASSGDIAQSGLIPSGATAYQFTENAWIGLVSAAPFGNITKPRTFWAGQTYSRSSRVTSYNFAPIVGVKLTDTFAVAVGPAVQYFKVRLNSATAPTLAAGNVILEGDDLSAGMTAGATWTPLPGTVLGVGYRSTIRHEVQGTLRTPLAVLPVKVNINLPEQITAGITQAITPELRLSAGFEWTNWSRLGTQAISLLNTGTPVAPFPLAYKDGFLYSVGGEYQWGPRWTFRTGVAYETSPIDAGNRSTRLPDSDRVYASIGASYAWSEKLTINAAYQHVFSVGENNYRIVPGHPQFNGLPFFGSAETDVNVFSLSARYRWDDPKVAEAAPIIRKY